MKIFWYIWRVSFIYSANAWLCNTGVYSDLHRWKGCVKIRGKELGSFCLQNHKSPELPSWPITAVSSYDPLIQTLKLKPKPKSTERAFHESFKNPSSFSCHIPEELCNTGSHLKSVGDSGYTSNHHKSSFLHSNFSLYSPFKERFHASSFHVCAKAIS